MWEVRATDEYLDWFRDLDGSAKSAILAKVLLLETFGPALGRPHADTLKRSRVKNLKELRTRTASRILRVIFYFDEERQALLLIGGDKKGKNESAFYKSLIQLAEILIERYRG
jgi:hypothetical protein